MLKKLVSAPTNDITTLRKKLFTSLLNGKFEDTLAILHGYPEYKVELLRGRGSDTGKNVIFWLGRYIEKNQRSAQLKRDLSNPESPISRVLKEMSCVADLLDLKISNDVAAPTGIGYLSTLFSHQATLETCIQYLGASVGHMSHNDDITWPLRQSEVWKGLKDKIPASAKPHVLVFGPGIFTDSSFSVQTNEGTTTFHCSKPFSPQIHEICLALGSIKQIDVVDCSPRVIALLQDSAASAIPDYVSQCRIKREGGTSQPLPPINPLLESIEWTPNYFSKFRPKTYDVITATYVFCYPIRETNSSNLIETTKQVYQQLCNALNPGGVLIVDANSFLASFKIVNSDLEVRWNDLMAHVKSTLSVFPPKTFTLEQIMDYRPHGTNHYFCFTRKSSGTKNGIAKTGN